MKRAKSLLALLLVFCAADLLYAKIGISLSINRSVYMQHEHIYGLVTLRNNAGRPLLFGSDPALQGFLTLDIRDRNNRPVAKVPGQEISLTGIMLAPGETRKVILPLNRYYQLHKAGRYRVSANITHNALGGEYRSKIQLFRISEGVQVWRRTVGMPDLTGKSKAGDLIPERTYAIYILNDRTKSYYYLKVFDEKQIYGVCLVGKGLGYERYQVDVDMLSRIHLLMPVAPRIFHYLAFSADGKNIANSYWRSAGTIPTLDRNNKTGVVTRVGGVQARPGRDFAAPDAGKVTLTDILQEERRHTPKAPAYGGMVDLGKGAVPEFEKDEK